MYKSHPKLSTPSDNTQIWRYMTLDKFLYLLFESKLYFNRSDCFHDQWEGVWPEAMVKTFKTREFDDLFEPGFGEKILEISEGVKKNIFVNCWHINKHESAAMWDIYGGNEASIAVKSTVKRLKQGIKTDSDFWIGRVKYMDYQKDIINMTDFDPMELFFIKRKSFKHDQELRIVKKNVPKENGKVEWDQANTSIQTEIDLNTIIQEVYISPSAPERIYTIVYKLMKMFGCSSIKIIQSNLNQPAIY